MNRKELKALLQYAKRMGYMKFPFMDVKASYEKDFKLYKRPKTSVLTVETPKRNRMSFIQMEDLRNILRRKKEGIAEMLTGFDIQATIVIGGSLSLKFQMREFYDREFHDVDFIITPATKYDRETLFCVFSTLNKAGLGYFCDSYNTKKSSFILGQLRFAGIEHPVNLIVKEECEVLPFEHIRDFNNPWEVFAAKRKYIQEDRAKERLSRRYKDIIDLYKIS